MEARFKQEITFVNDKKEELASQVESMKTEIATNVEEKQQISAELEHLRHVFKTEQGRLKLLPYIFLLKHLQNLEY